MNKKNIAIKELSASERPFEKAIRFGMQSLSDRELLSIFIRSGTKDSSALDISDKILNFRAGNLRNLVDLSYDEFLNFPGIGEIKAIQLQAIAEIAERLSRNKRSRNKRKMASCIWGSPHRDRLHRHRYAPIQHRNSVGFMLSR